MKSIMQDEKRCFLCGRNGSGDPLERHHVFGGPNRQLSEEDGLVVWLCGDRCHRYGEWAVHANRYAMRFVQKEGQRRWEAEHGSREDFIKRYGKSYI